MGLKAVYMIGGISVLSSLLLMIGTLLPMHKLNFYGLFAFHLAQIETHLTSINLPVGRNEFCYVMHQLAGIGKKEQKYSEHWCDHMQGSHDIQDVAMYMCTPAMTLFWPDLCDGLNSAYACGMTMIVILCSNLFLQAVGFYFLYDYSTRKANPKYREMGGCSLLGGSILLVFGLVLYFFMVLHRLDSIRNGFFLSLVLRVDEHDGIGPGFIFCVMGCVVQLIQLAFYPMVQREYMEDDYLDKKLMKEEAREYGTMNNQQPMMQPGGFGFQQPVMQPSGFGFQQPMMQPTGMAFGAQPVLVGAPMMAVGFSSNAVITSGPAW